MGIITSLKHAKLEHHINALLWLILSSIGGLMPLWSLYILLRLFSIIPNIDLFTQNGEFALYSASFLSASFYVVTKDNGFRPISAAIGHEGRARIKTSFPGQRIFVIIFIILVLISSLLFSGVTFAHLQLADISLDKEFLRIWTLIIYGLTVILIYITTVLDNAISDYNERNYSDSRNAELDNLRNEFNSLQS